MPLTLQDYAFRKAQERNLDPAFVNRLITQESAWNPNAISPVGARGLMQIMPPTGRDLGLMTPAALMDPYQNIDAGTRYLQQLSRRYGGDQYKMAAAYNWGMGNVPVKGPLPRLPAETRNYVRKVVGPVAVGRSSTAPVPLPPPVRMLPLAPLPPEPMPAAPSLFETLYDYVFHEPAPPAAPAPSVLAAPRLPTLSDLIALGVPPGALGLPQITL